MNRRRRRQLAFHDFPGGFSGARIFSNNRWVQLAQIIPWDLVDQKYAEQFEGKRTGNPAIESRMAFGSLVIKQELGLSDEDTVTMIRENPHCQYFIGMEEFVDQAPFDASKMTAFRKRFSPAAIAEINEAIIAARNGNEPPSEGGGAGENDDGTLILDATCAPADIHFPTDAGVLHDAREQSEQLIDAIASSTPDAAKPRTYRQLARKNDLTLVRNKRPGYKLIRKTLKSQLQYLRRNRIVSVSQPWVRPIVRGKLTAKTEFGAKLAVSLEEGYARIEKLSWDAFNEAQTLIASCERYRERHGVYPQRILADKIYRNRTNLAYCKQRSIALNGPKLGRPPKDKTLYDEQKQQERKEAGERNAIEGKFGEGKRCYGLDRVMARLSETSDTSIHLIFLVMNLKKRLRDLFFAFFYGICSRVDRSRFFICAVEQ